MSSSSGARPRTEFWGSKAAAPVAAALSLATASQERYSYVSPSKPGSEPCHSKEGGKLQRVKPRN